MKKFKSYLSAALAVLIVTSGAGMGNFTAFAQEVPKAGAPKIEWNQDIPGMGLISIGGTVSGNEVSVSNASVYGAIYKDGVLLDDASYPLFGEPGNTWRWDVSSYIVESGTYQVQSKIVGQAGQYADSDMAAGPEFNYERPSVEMAQPQNVRWSKEEPGVLLWDSVEGAGGYSLVLYHNGSAIMHPTGNSRIPSEAGKTEKFDFSRMISDDGTYVAEVRALSCNINEAANGSKVGTSDKHIIGDVEDVNNSLESVMEGLGDIDPDNAEELAQRKDEISDAVRKVLESTDADELRQAMQSDAGTMAMIERLEQLYARSSNISVRTEVSPETGLDGSKISITGAALNADANAGVTFQISKPQEGSEAVIPSAQFKSVVQFHLDLSGIAADSAALKSPVMITMPVPAGIAPSSLIILHVKDDGSYEEVRPRYNGDGTCSFTVTGFSTFVFGEKVEQETGSEPATGGFTWEFTEEETRRLSYRTSLPVAYQASADSGREITVESEVQGKKFFDAIATLKQKYDIGYTYNMYTDKAKAADTDNSVRITLTIPEELRREGRRFVIIGVGKDGAPVVLKDEDKSNDTITFTVNGFYGFALAFQDNK